MKTFSTKAATWLFWTVWLVVFTATMVALSGVAQYVAVCNSEGFEGVLTYFNEIYQGAMVAKDAVVPFNCFRFQMKEWWALGSQITFLFAAVGVVLKRLLPRYKLALIALGCVATAQAVSLCWVSIEVGGGIYGTLKTAGLRTFFGFFFCAGLNTGLMFAICDLDWSLSQQRKEQKRALALQAGAALAAAPSNASDIFKRSESSATSEVRDSMV